MTDNEFLAIVTEVGQILLEQIENTDNCDDLLITYGSVASMLPGEFNPRNLDSPLGELSVICKELGLPLISTIVVNQETLMPGAGYFRYFFPGTKSAEWDAIFIEQLKKVRECSDWTPLAGELGLE